MPNGNSLGWAYGDKDPWHEESDDEDVARTRADHVCDECSVNLDIDGHEPWCSYEKGTN